MDNRATTLLLLKEFFRVPILPFVFLIPWGSRWQNPTRCQCISGHTCISLYFTDELGCIKATILLHGG